jgi:hypothetical protein
MSAKYVAALRVVDQLAAGCNSAAPRVAPADRPPARAADPGESLTGPWLERHPKTADALERWLPRATIAAIAVAVAVGVGYVVYVLANFRLDYI